MKITPPKHYSEEHLQILYKELHPNSYLAGFLNTAKYDNKDLFNLIIKQSHSKKYSSHSKNRIRSIRVVLYEVSLKELVLWVSETDPELKAIIKWRLSVVG